MEKRTFLSDRYGERVNGREPLDRRYGKIGISAVAAAVRYQGASKAEGTAHDEIDDQVSAKSAA